VLKNLPHHSWEGNHNTVASLKFEALRLASEAQLGLVEGLYKLVENQAQAISWDWGNWGSMHGAMGSIYIGRLWLCGGIGRKTMVSGTLFRRFSCIGFSVTKNVVGSWI
jgi:hypothetical protein